MLPGWRILAIDVHRNRDLRPAAARGLPVAEGEEVVRTPDRGCPATPGGGRRRSGLPGPVRSDPNRRGDGGRGGGARRRGARCLRAGGRGQAGGGTALRAAATLRGGGLS